MYIKTEIIGISAISFSPIELQSEQLLNPNLQLLARINLGWHWWNQKNGTHEWDESGVSNNRKHIKTYAKAGIESQYPDDLQGDCQKIGRTVRKWRLKWVKQAHDSHDRKLASF